MSIRSNSSNIFLRSLFLGGVLGAIFHNICELLSSNSGIPEVASYQLSGLPAFAMIGSASVLAALFRAPLTARYVCLRFWLSLFPCHSIFLPPSLLLFETTRNYDVILPLMASAGRYQTSFSFKVVLSLTYLHVLRISHKVWHH